MKVRTTYDDRVVIGFDSALGWARYEDMSPEEAMRFATEIINKAYPLTAAVKRKTETKPNEYQAGFCSQYKSGRR